MFSPRWKAVMLCTMWPWMSTNGSYDEPQAMVMKLPWVRSIKCRSFPGLRRRKNGSYYPCRFEIVPIQSIQFSVDHAISAPTLVQASSRQNFRMKAFAFLTTAITMMAANAVAQETHKQCIDRCLTFYKDCVEQGGTDVFCGSLRGKSRLSPMIVEPLCANLML